MVTAEEIGAVAVFATLDTAERERLSRATADIGPVPGEYAAHEGDERAIFAVLSAGSRRSRPLTGSSASSASVTPGDVFGEVPIVLGTVFPVGFRAAEDSRVVRIEAHDYHAVAAEVPDVSKEIGKLAGHRIGGSRGLEAIAADPPPSPPRAIVVGHRWDASCAELRRFLDRNQITFKWLTPRPRTQRTSGVARARTIILACGVTWRHVEIEGFDRLAGNGISYGAAAARLPIPTASTSISSVAENSAGQADLSSPPMRAA